MRAWRVSQVNQRYLERHLRDSAADWWRYPSVPFPTLLASLHFVEAHVLGFAMHPACVAYTMWRSHVLSVLMRYGVYAPERGHEPAPGEELDVIEIKAHLQEAFDAVFPGLKRYCIVTDADGTRHAEALPPYEMEEDDDE